MGKFECKCGTLLSNSKDPNDVQLWVFEDKEYKEEILDKYEKYNIYFPKNDVWRCKKCLRLYFINHEMKVIRCYVVEDEYKFL